MTCWDSDLIFSFSVNLQQEEPIPALLYPGWRTRVLSTRHMRLLSGLSRLRSVKTSGTTSLSSAGNWTSTPRISEPSMGTWRNDWTTGRPKPCGLSWTKEPHMQITNRGKSAWKTRWWYWNLYFMFWPNIPGSSSVAPGNSCFRFFFYCIFFPAINQLELVICFLGDCQHEYLAMAWYNLTVLQLLSEMKHVLFFFSIIMFL